MPRSILYTSCGDPTRMMRMKDSICKMSATIFPKNVCFGLKLFLIVMCTISADGDLDIVKCSSTFKLNRPTVLCISMTREYWKYKTDICPKNDLIQIVGFLLHIPMPNKQDVCDTSISTIFNYNNTLDISCLMKASPRETMKLLEQIMEGFSGKVPSEVNSSHVQDQFINNKLFGLPEFTLLDLNYTCLNKDDGIVQYVDMCETVNVTDDVGVHIFFNVTSYSMFAALPACSCVITSINNQSISLRAVDVRLAGDTQLHLSAARTMVMDSSQLHWWQDGVLMTSPGELLLDLTSLNPSELPHSIWLYVSGHDLSIRCGNYTWPSLKVAADIENHLWYAVMGGIIAAVVVLLLLLATILWRCVCRRSQVDKEYAVVKTSNEIISCRVARKAVEDEDECMYKSLASHVYYEVEPNYAQTLPSCSSTENGQKSEGIEMCQDEPRSNCSGSQENIYSHLKESSHTRAGTDLYDTILGDDYSTLQRTIPETLIDNIYNT